MGARLPVLEWMPMPPAAKPGHGLTMGNSSETKTYFRPTSLKYFMAPG